MTQGIYDINDYRKTEDKADDNTEWVFVFVDFTQFMFNNN